MNMDTGEIRQMSSTEARHSIGRWVMLGKKELGAVERIVPEHRVEALASFLRQFNPKKAKRLGL